LPENYVDDPPNDIEAVESNIAILQDVLNPTVDKYNTKALIRRLQDLIYPRITEFLENGIYILAQRLGKSYDEIGLDEIERIICEQPEQFGDTDVVWMDTLAKDLQYLVEMRKMEDPEYSKMNTVSFHIVPISGLTFSLFIRLENENKTALELWKRAPEIEPEIDQMSVVLPVPRGPTCLDSTTRPRPPPHLLDVLDDMSHSEILDLLHQQQLDGTADLNRQDSSGWTALHSVCNNSEMLQVVDKMLDDPELDVAIANTDGNTSLHYLVRLRCGPKKRDMRIQMLKKLIARNPSIVGIANKKHEFPLHYACGTSDAALVLLEHGADVNVVTALGETTLHCAVRRCNIATIELLLRFNAHVNATSEKGETPLDLALANKKPEVVQLLQAAGGISSGIVYPRASPSSVPTPTAPAPAVPTAAVAATSTAIDAASTATTGGVATMSASAEFAPKHSTTRASRSLSLAIARAPVRRTPTDPSSEQAITSFSADSAAPPFNQAYSRGSTFIGARISSTAAPNAGAAGAGALASGARKTTIAIGRKVTCATIGTHPTTPTPAPSTTPIPTPSTTPTPTPSTTTTPTPSTTPTPAPSTTSTPTS
jgi:ankyrin repeat protein